MAIDFPNSPTAGQSFTVGAKTWQWVDPSLSIGGIGPSGGKVFITPSTVGNSTGKYFEAAPVTTPDVIRSWATNVNSNQTTAVSGADGTAIGTGEQNTLDIVAQTGNIAATCAAVYCSEYAINGFSDWFLPSRDELTEMYTNSAVVGGFSSSYYWSSSEYTDPGFPSSDAYDQNFVGPGQTPSIFGKNAVQEVRPVRSFTVEGGRWVVVDNNAQANNQIYDIMVLMKMETN
jgi:hypothetical protein